MEYIHLNPMRAGLVKRAEEWQWSSVHDYNGGLSVTFRPNRTLARDCVLLPPDERGGMTISSHPTEGLNNRLKLTLRKAYGFRTFRAAEAALYHSLRALPEPECTHRFC